VPTSQDICYVTEGVGPVVTRSLCVLIGRHSIVGTNLTSAHISGRLICGLDPDQALNLYNGGGMDLRANAESDRIEMWAQFRFSGQKEILTIEISFH
jgi:hypothetical protein